MRAYLEGRGAAPYLIGAGASLYLAWNLGTALGAGLITTVPDPRNLGLRTGEPRSPRSSPG